MGVRENEKRQQVLRLRSRQSKGTSTGQSGGDGKTSSGGIKPVDETPGATLLLPYFECDLSKGNTCSNGGKK
jgi:hypothetical protein